MNSVQFKFVFLLIILMCIVNVVFAQTFKVNLSSKQLAKIEKAKQATKKLKRYHKYFKRDSARHMREINRFWQKKSDSITKAMLTQEKQKLYREKMGIKDPIDTLAILNQYVSLLPDQSIPDRELKISLPHEKALNPSLTTLKNNFTDSLSLKYGVLKEKDAISDEARESIPLETQEKLRKFHINHSASDIQQYLIVDSTALKKARKEALLSAKEKSLETLPIGQRRQIEEFQKKHGAYSHELKQYLFFLKDSVNRLDTLNSLAKDKGKGMAEEVVGNDIISNSDLKKLNELTSKMKEAKNQSEEYKQRLKQYQNKEFIQKEAKDFVKKNQGTLTAIQSKMSLLMNKYSSVPNSNDMSTAVKRTSLKGKKLSERLMVSGQFQILSWQPFSIDASPGIGYKFNTRLSSGIGINYRKTFADTIPSIAATVWGFKSFISYDIYKSFFLYGEYALNTPRYNFFEGHSKHIWIPSGLVGVGRKFPINSKINLTAVVLYDLLRNPKDPIQSQPLSVRIGFQLNNLKLTKK